MGTTARHDLAAFVATVLLLGSLAFAAGRVLGPDVAAGANPGEGVTTADVTVTSEPG